MPSTMSKLPLISASAAHYLPSEIIEAILPFLPAKSLGRFKSVSKTWNSLISDPQFIKTHLYQNHQPSKLILISDAKSLYSVEISELLQCLTNDDLFATAKELGIGQAPIRWTYIWASCNGLVLASEENGTMLLMNPTTREVWKIPLSPFALQEHSAFWDVYGLGYDSSTDDYKVVCILYWHPHAHGMHDPDDVDDVPDMYVSVYSLRKNSWRKLSNTPYNDSKHYLITNVVMNGNLHWLASSSRIVTLNLTTEEFNEMELPCSIVNKGLGFCDLLVIHGKLGLVGIGKSDELWVMEEYGVSESWTRVCSLGVGMDSMNRVCLESRWILLSQFWSNYDGDEVVVYDIDERRYINERIVGGPRRFTYDVGGRYVETLESPKRIITPP